ncbi:tryptophan synthase subunit alpha [uncultured Microscilla sp.]|uniref:tryptophan synthase subunit alpha n=1 Tax=uncultured Microscilla sp. TaxID=432653 RepID=UPI0026030213|nr:tryptophan synthase subunit alpha [uncultured Microscilla sp.]
MNNRLTNLFTHKKENLLAIYFTAGFPALDQTIEIAKATAEAGADIIEIGMPFSDPVADGETIQQSNQQALDNGMHLELLFSQLANLRKEVEVPVLLMGYLNPVMQFGLEKFCQKAAEVGVDGLILPDLPMQEYEETYRPVFEQHNLSNVFLMTPQTSEERIRKIDALTNGFIYVMSSASTTGKTGAISTEQEAYFERVAKMKLKNPRLIGFGISDNASFSKACQHANGAIIGSAFIKTLAQSQQLNKDIGTFIKTVKGETVLS